MKKLLIYSLCLLTLAGCSGRKPEEKPAPTPPAPVPSGPVTPETQKPEAPGGQTRPAPESAGDQLSKTAGELWLDMKEAAGDLADLAREQADRLLLDWKLSDGLVVDYAGKTYSDGRGGVLVLLRARDGRAALIKEQLMVSHPDLRVWVNGDYVLVSDSDRADAVAEHFRGLKF